MYYDTVVVGTVSPGFMVTRKRLSMGPLEEGGEGLIHIAMENWLAPLLAARPPRPDNTKSVALVDATSDAQDPVTTGVANANVMGVEHGYDSTNYIK